MEKIKGLLVAPFTAFTEKNEINTEIVHPYAELLKRSELSGVFINGSSGEGYMLTAQERMTLAETWVKEQKPDFKVMVHVGTTCLEEAVLLAHHAESIGAWGIGCMAPPFPPIATMEELVKYCEQIAAGAPSLPFYFYHIPAFNHANFPMSAFLKEVDDRIPNFAGIKFTYENMYDFNQCTLYKNGKFDMLHGQDETILAALALCDTKGGISGTANYIGTSLVGVMNAWQEGDIQKARSLQNYAQEVINVICRYRCNIVGGKRIMKFLGLDMGLNRVPFRNMSEAEEEAMKQELQNIGFFEQCNK